MGPPRRRRRWLIVLLGFVGTLAILIFGLVFSGAYASWREGSRQGGQQPADPFRIAGSLYYVGASDVASFLITGPEGHVLIDGGYPGTPPLIVASIAKLGFDIKDVKVLLNSEPHLEHAHHRRRRRRPRRLPAAADAHLDRSHPVSRPARRSPVQGRRHHPRRAGR